MQCPNVMARLSAYVEHDLPPREEAAVTEHLATCARCRAEAAAREQTEKALCSLTAVVPAPDLTADLRRRIATPVRSFRWAWSGAAAAVAVGLIACLALRTPGERGQARPQGPRGNSSVVQGEPVPAGSMETGASSPRPSVSTSTSGAGLPPPSHRFLRRQGRPRPQTPGGSSVSMRGEPAPVAGRSAGRGEFARGGRVHRACWIGPPLRVMAPAPPETEPTAVPASIPAPPAVAQAPGTPAVPKGVVLVVGEPQPVLPSFSYFAQVTLPDGETTTLEQTIQRDAGGLPRAVRISYRQTPPPTTGAEGRPR